MIMANTNFTEILSYSTDCRLQRKFSQIDFTFPEVYIAINFFKTIPAAVLQSVSHYFFFSESSQSAPVGIPGKTSDAQVCILAYQIVCSITHLTIVLEKDASTVVAVKLIVIQVKILITSNNLFRAVNKGRQPAKSRWLVSHPQPAASISFYHNC